MTPSPDPPFAPPRRSQSPPAVGANPEEDAFIFVNSSPSPENHTDETDGAERGRGGEEGEGVGAVRGVLA